MNKNGILNEKELLALVKYFDNEPFSNVQRYILLTLSLCKDEPKKRNKYMVGWGGNEHEATKSAYRELCRGCDGDVDKMIERCKEDEDLRAVIFTYAFNSLLLPLMLGLHDVEKCNEQ